ncbi:MAG TPA: patatin-like phospholipase family protein [Thermomicrobiales bacterium]|nr:patatin-like phospholipase family protein [Thermomicrobiales bacterium]
MLDNSNVTIGGARRDLYGNALFAGLSTRDIDAITRRLTPVELLSGETLFHEGERGSELYLVLAGLIQIYATRGSQDVTISTLTPGTYFGEMALLGQDIRSASARAIERCVLLPIDSETFSMITEQYPAITANMGRRLVDQLVATTRTMVHQQRGELVLVAISRVAELRNFVEYLSEAVAAMTDGGIAVLAPRAALKHHTSLLAAVRSGQRPVIPDRDTSVAPTFFAYRAGSLLGEGTVEDAIGSLIDYFRRWWKRTIIFVSDQEQEWLTVALTRVDRAFIICPPEELEWWHPDTLTANTDARFPEIEAAPMIAPGTRRRDAVDAVERAGFARPLIVLPQHAELEAATARAFEREHLATVHVPMQRTVLRLARALARARVGIALGAGGARGWAHTGVYRYLEELGIPIDAVSGTSIGALVGGGIAMGLTSHECEAAMLDWMQSGFKKLIRPALTRHSILSGKAIEDACRGVFHDLDFNDIDTPLTVVGADLVSGRGVALRRGSITQSVRASMSIPGMFPPVLIGPHVLVDGGVCNPVPTDLLPSLGADISIVVNISFSAEDLDRWMAEEGEAAPPRSIREGKYPNLLDTYLAAFGIAVAERAETSGLQGDIYIRPKFLVTSWREFSQGPDHLKRGYAAAVVADEQLRGRIPWLS